MKLLALTYSLLSLSLSSIHAGEPFVFDEATMRSQPFADKIRETIKVGNCPTGKILKEMVDVAEKRETITIKKVVPEPVETVYDYGKERTYVVARIYNCGKCDKWHMAKATAWAMSEDGIMVTNYHIFRSALEEGVAVVGHDMEIYPISEVLIVDKVADFAIFKVKLPEGAKLKTFPIGESATPGDQIHLVSNPLSDYYYYNKGYVGGYKIQKNSTINNPRKGLWMRTEISYRGGSSGGAMYNDNGEAVGMVCYIRTIFENGNKKKGDPVDKYAIKTLESAVAIATIKKRLVIEE